MTSRNGELPGRSVLVLTKQEGGLGVGPHGTWGRLQAGLHWLRRNNEGRNATDRALTFNAHSKGIENRSVASASSTRGGRNRTGSVRGTLHKLSNVDVVEEVSKKNRITTAAGAEVRTCTRMYRK